MIKFRHNDMMDRHEVDFETKLGNLDQVITVAVIDENNAITFYKTLDIEDAQEIIMEWKFCYGIIIHCHLLYRDNEK